MIGSILTLLFFLFPGILTIPSKNFLPRMHVIEKIPACIGISLAYWILSFWMISVIPISHRFLLSTSLGTAIGVGFSLLWKKNHTGYTTLSSLPMKLALASWLIILAIPAMLLAANLVAPTGADMSMHAYFAKIIYLADRFPTTMEPLVPLSHFGYYPIGFPVLIASLMHLNLLPVHTNAVLISVFTYWLFAASIYTLLRVRFSMLISMMVTVTLTWVSRTPNDIIAWGANPMILSLSFLILGCAFMKDALTYSRAWLFVIFLLAGALLTHYIIPIAFFYVAFALLSFFAKYITKMKHSIVIRYILFTLLLMAPFLWHMKTAPFIVSAKTIQFVQSLQRDEISGWTGMWDTTVLSGLTTFLLDTFGLPFIVFSLSMLVVRVATRKKEVWAFLFLIIWFVLLLLNSRVWFLPLSALLYPKRVLLIFLIPLSIGIASGLEVSIKLIQDRLVQRKKHVRRAVAALGCMLVLIVSYPTIKQNVLWFTSSYVYSAVTNEDIAALLWLKEHSKKTAVILNNYHDAGLWIPAIAERKITTYHTNPIDMDAVTPTIGQETYAFIGNKSITDNPATEVVRSSVVEAESFRYQKVYQNRNAAIYKIRTD